MKEFKIVDELNLEAKKSLGILKEFKEFALRGNVVDLAVGVVIGAAFSKVVTSIVSDFIAPLIGLLTGGGADLKNKFISLEPGKTLGINTLADAQKVAPVIAYGQFIATVIDFVIVAFFIFLVVKFTNRFKNTEPLPPAPPTNQEKLLTEIRDILKARA